MTVIDRNRAKLFERASRLYQGGDYRGTLSLLSDAGGRNDDPRVLVLMANANLKLGQAEAGADLFARLADLIGQNRAFFLKSAATLYLRIGAAAKLAAIGAKTIRANPDDSNLAFEILKIIHQDAPAEVVEPLLDHLNRSEPEQAYFVTSFHRDRKKDLDRSYAVLVDGINKAPDDGFLKLQRYSAARMVCDFPIMRAFEDLVSSPRSPFGEQVFVNQMALERLYWSDDERAHVEPTQSSRSLAARKSAGNCGPRPRRAVSSPSERLRIGYISNDFGHEVVMTVFRPVLESHDAEKFDIRLFCYSNAEVRKFQEAWPEALRSKIISIADLSDEAAAQAISAAKIDILVDLKGHTKGDRLNIMNITDAPVTATYLGYPGSVFGADIDYLISDPIVTPDSSKPHYAEKLCRLPEVQMPNKALSDDVVATKRSDWGLPEDRFVFASFNAQQKITPRTFDLWCRILGSVPDSVFWIACDSPLARQNLIAEFCRSGIAEDRIIFNQKAPRFGHHIGRLALADLALDTLPYNGHSTTADMLRGGLPVLTVKGQSYHSRVSWSLLRSCGIDELAADSDADYCRLAESLASDPARLQDIRSRLWENRQRSPLFDPERMARHLERAYEMMAERARHGLPPDHIEVPALRLAPSGYAPEAFDLGIP